MKLMYRNFNLLELHNIMAVEFLGVLEGVKEVARFNFSEKRMKHLKKACKELGMFMEVSDYQVLVISGSDKVHISVGKAVQFDKSGNHFAYVSKQKKKALIAKKLDEIYIEEEGHEELARYLGYPKCCINFYNKHRAEAVKRNRDDYALISLRESKGFVFPFYNNNIKRYFHATLMTFFPCSYNCKKAETFSKRIFTSVKKYSPEFGEHLLKVLRTTMIYTNFNGVHELIGSHLQENILTYTNVNSTINNEFHNILKEGNKIKIINHSLFKVMKRDKVLKILKKDCGILVFE